MENKEQSLLLLREFYKEKIEELKNENPDVEVDIEDIVYCGQIEIEVDGEKQKKDVFLVKENIDGNVKMKYYTEDDLIAIDYNEMIIPSEEYQHCNLKEIQKDENRVSLNELEEDRINNVSKIIGIDEKDIEASSEIDTKKLNEEELLRKNVNIKNEFSSTQKITSTENFENIVPGANKYSKIAVIYSSKTTDRFCLVGITNDGKVEKLEGLERTEGVNSSENIVTSDRKGEEVKQKTTSAMFRVKGRPNEAFSMYIGNAGCVEVNYVRRSMDDEYISIPVESDHTRYVKSELKRDLDKTKNTRVEEEVDRAQEEFKEHNGKTDFKNIDDNPKNDVNHDNIIKTENGREITFEQVIDEIEREQNVSRGEAERLFRENYDENKTYEKIKADIEEEIEEQMRIPNRNKYM